MSELTKQVAEEKARAERVGERRKAAEARAKALETRLQYMMSRTQEEEREKAKQEEQRSGMAEQVREAQRHRQRDLPAHTLPPQVEEMKKELSRTRGRLRRVSESNRSMAAAMRSQASGVEGSLAAGAKGRARSMTQLPAVERRGRSASRSRPASGASWASGRSAQRSASATRRGRRAPRRDRGSRLDATVPTVAGAEPGPEGDAAEGGEEKVRRGEWPASAAHTPLSCRSSR